MEVLVGWMWAGALELLEVLWEKVSYNRGAWWGPGDGPGFFLHFLPT